MLVSHVTDIIFEEFYLLTILFLDTICEIQGGEVITVAQLEGLGGVHQNILDHLMGQLLAQNVNTLQDNMVEIVRFIKSARKFSLKKFPKKTHLHLRRESPSNAWYCVFLLAIIQQMISSPEWFLIEL